MTTSSITDHKTQTRNKIKSRLLKKAAEAWGYQDWEMDAFDPLVSLLIEACSVEFEKLYTEINTTQNRILERLSHVLIPEVIDTVHPACGIMQTRASDATALLQVETQFVVKKQYLPAASGNQKNYSDIFFTPLQSCKIFNAAIEFIATDQVLWQVENGLTKNIVGSRQYIVPKTYHSVWIGLEIGDQVKTLNGLSFFFDWFNEPDKAWFLQYLSFSKWLQNEKEINYSVGLKNYGDGAEARPQLEDAFNPLKKIERTIKGLFTHNYLTLEDDSALRSFKKVKYPPAFEKTRQAAFMVRNTTTSFFARNSTKYDVSSHQHVPGH